ncbi:MAG: hypothetical protein L6R42_006019 [Xanthoria sp. 1 TBL-2021]|nr:MAG: hypothetical protein L6R42_006019 [Xanthoria sp. 1 TBL-2021]
MIQDEAHLFKVLIATGLDVNSTDHKGYNIALKTSRDQDFDKLKRLKRYGVDISTRSHQGRTALHVLACQETPYTDPTAKNRLELLKFFMGYSIDVNAQDHWGDTLLHVAFSNPGVGNVRLFLVTALEVGAEPDIRNYRGRTIAYTAAGADTNNSQRHRNENHAPELLLESHMNVDIDLTDFDGRTPLHLAAMRIASRVYRLLCAGSNVTALDHQARSVLHYAPRVSNSNILGLINQTLQDAKATDLLRKKIVMGVRQCMTRSASVPLKPC